MQIHFFRRRQYYAVTVAFRFVERVFYLVKAVFSRRKVFYVREQLIFVGYFLAAFAEDGDISRAMRLAAAASALEVTRPGAAASIPAREEAERFLRGMA